MKRILVNFSLIFFSCLLTWLMAEGARSIYFGGEQHLTLLEIAKRQLSQLDKAKKQNDELPPKEVAQTAHTDFFVTSRDQFLEFIDEMQSVHGALGNTDFNGLVTDSAAVNGYGPCDGTKPNLDKSFTQIRSNVFNSFDPPVFIADRNAKLSPRFSEFLRKYGFDPIRLTSNAAGERTTVPLMERKEKVLVAGDSVALGVMVDDEFTLASQLQQRDGSRQYINIGIGGAGIDQIGCAMDEAAKRYRGQISELIYVACDNDFMDGVSAETPEGLLRRLKEFRERNGIKRLIVLRASYIYDNLPFYPSPPDVNRRVVLEMGEKLKSSGLPFVDMLDLMQEEQRTRKNIFAGLEFYVDHVHWSREGTAKMAAKVVELRRAAP